MIWLKSSLPLRAGLAVFLISLSALSQGPAPAKSPSVKKTLQADDSSARRQFTTEELEQKFFKNKIQQKKTNLSTEIFLPVFYERMEKPLARIKSRAINKVTGITNLEIDGTALVAIMSEIVQDPWRQKIKDLPLACDKNAEVKDKEELTCWVDITTFNDPEIKVEFSEQLLEVRIRVPPNMRTKKMTSLLRFGSAGLEEATHKPSWFSTYVNVNLSQDFRSDVIVFKNGRMPLAGYYDSGTRLGPIAIEAKARSVEKRTEAPTNDPVFVREDVRVVYDFQSFGTRAQVGDLSYPVRGFQAYRPLGGASFFTQTSLQASQLTLPTGSYEIYLKNPSKIGIYINENLIQTLSLPAGRHNLRDFPFVIGLNDLRLEITDNTGVIEVQNYTYFSSNELLKVGQSELSYAVGAPWTETEGERIYDSKRTTFSAFHRYGFLQNVSLGANIQKDPFQTIGGVEVLFSTSVGYFSLEPVYSLNQDHPSGYGGRMRYIVQDFSTKEKNNRFTSFELSTLSSDFTQLGIRDPVNPVSNRFLMNHSRAVSPSSNLNLGLGYNFARQATDTTGDFYSLSAGINHRWFNGFSTNLNFRHTKSAAGKEDISTLLFLVWSFPRERQFVTASTESATNSSRADWTYQPSAGVGGLGSRVNLQNKPTGRGYGESIEYTGNRVRLNQSHQVEIIKEDASQPTYIPQRSLHTTNLQMGTALVFAGGHFGISRPVTDSFAMLVPLENLDGKNIMVNPQKNGTYLAETDWMGSAVASELPSYSPTTLTIGQKQTQTAVSLPRDHFTLNPTLHSGYAIPIGTDATVYLKTKLLNEDQTPVSMIAAQAIYLGDGEKEPVTIFTNRNGLVRSEGFRPGRYRLEFSEDDYESTEFTIPEGAAHEFELPALQLKASKK